MGTDRLWKISLLPTSSSHSRLSSLSFVHDRHTTSWLLFTSPEALLATMWKKAIKAPDISSRIVAVAIDEAHCVWKW